MQVNFRSILIYYIIRIHNSNKWMLSFSVEFTDFQKQNNPVMLHLREMSS